MTRVMAAVVRIGFFLAVLTMILHSGETVAQELVRSEDAVVALFSLQTELTVDIKILERLEARYDRNRQDREDARRRVSIVYSDLESLFDQYREARRRPEGDEEEETIGIADLEALIEESEQALLAAERAETGIRDEGRRLRDEIRNMRERIALLGQQIETLRASLPTQREAVTGVWDVTLMPGGDNGVFALFQSGTVVSGQYVLDGPFQGSLDGTLIDRKLILQRIDARLGRSMDFSAYLSPDGQSLRGTWENYDLANGQARTGSWSARRRQPPVGETAGDEGGN